MTGLDRTPRRPNRHLIKVYKEHADGTFTMTPEAKAMFERDEELAAAEASRASFRAWLAAQLANESADFCRDRLAAYGSLDGPIPDARTAAKRVRILVGGCIAPSMRRLERESYIALDWADGTELGVFMLDASLPTALVMGVPGQFLSVPLTWTKQSVVFGPTAIAPAVTIDLNGPHAGAMLIDAIITLVAAFVSERAIILEAMQ